MDGDNALAVNAQAQALRAQILEHLQCFVEAAQAEGVPQETYDLVMRHASGILAAGNALLAEVIVRGRVMQLLRDQLADALAQNAHLSRALMHAEQNGMAEGFRLLIRQAARELSLKPGTAAFFIQAIIGEGVDLSPYYREQLQALAQDVAAWVEKELE